MKKAATYYGEQRWPGCRILSITPYYAFDGSINAYAVQFGKNGAGLMTETALDPAIEEAQGRLDAVQLRRPDLSRTATASEVETWRQALRAARNAAVLADQVGTVIVAARADMYPLLERFDGVAPHLKFKTKVRALAGLPKTRKQAIARTFYVGPMAYFHEPAEDAVAPKGIPRRVVNPLEGTTFDFTKRKPTGRMGRLAPPARGKLSLSPQQMWLAVAQGTADRGTESPADPAPSPPEAAPTNEILGVPYYHQDDYGPNSCAPTASAQALGYWDDNGYGFFIDNGDSTTGHEDELIYGLMGNMFYSPKGGTTWDSFLFGIAVNTMGYLTTSANALSVSWENDIKQEIQKRRPFVYWNLDLDQYPKWEHATTGVGYNETVAHILFLHYNYPPDTPYELFWDNINHDNERILKLYPIESAMLDCVWSEDCERFLSGWKTAAQGADPGFWWNTDYRFLNTGGGVPSRSAYCVQITTPAPGPYPKNVDSWMIRGPFSTLGKTEGKFTAYIWRDIPDTDGDAVSMLASLNGSNYAGVAWTGIDKNWNQGLLDLENVPGLGSVLNKPEVWVAVRFVSDGDGLVGEGAYVDNLEIVLRPVSPVVVRAPDGDESWVRGNTYKIRWNTVGNLGLGSVKIELFKGGAHYHTISNSAINDGLYHWAVPGWIEPGDDFKIRISELSDPARFGFSPEPFSILAEASITVISPNGGETWAPGTPHTIKWSKKGNSGNTIVIRLDKGGAPFKTISPPTQNDGEFVWSIPPSETEGSDYRIYVFSTSKNNIQDSSDADFSIDYRGIAVRAPKHGDWWQKGQTFNITWTHGAGTGNNVRIELLFARTLTPIADATPNDGLYAWTIPGSLAPSSLYKIKVSSLDVPQFFDFSDAFSILEGPGIGVVAPNGGEWWFPGNSQVITWTSDLPTTQPALLHLFKGGVMATTITLGTENDGSYTWNVPEDLPAGLDYQIRVYSRPALDLSDEYFAIVTPDIEVIEPQDGQVVLPGGFLLIEWETLGIPNQNMRIDLFRGDERVLVVTTSTLRSMGPEGETIPSDSGGVYDWDVPADLPPASDYRVKVTSLWNPRYFDFSEGRLAVVTTPALTLVSPNGGEVWRRNRQHEIRWDSRGLPETEVAIELYRGSGRVPPTTIAVVTNFLGSYWWKIPAHQLPASDYRIRVVSLWDSSVADVSDATFVIEAYTAVKPENWRQY